MAAQTPSGDARGASSTTRPPVTRPSTTLQPSLDILKQALAGMSVDKWKASTAIRSEAEANLASVQRDVDSTLPSLLATADAAPDSVAKTLPVFRNVDALYDVLLRLDAAARLAAPKDQMSAIDQALASISNSRRALGDQLQANAEAQDTRVMHLEATLKAVPPPPPPTPTPVACTPPAPAKKKHVTKPAAKSSTSSSQSSPSTQSSTPSH